MQAKLPNVVRNVSGKAPSVISYQLQDHGSVGAVSTTRPDKLTTGPKRADMNLINEARRREYGVEEDLP